MVENKQADNDMLVMEKSEKLICVEIVYPSFRWYHQESNRGHKDFQLFIYGIEVLNTPGL